MVWKTSVLCSIDAMMLWMFDGCRRSFDRDLSRKIYDILGSLEINYDQVSETL